MKVLYFFRAIVCDFLIFGSLLVLGLIGLPIVLVSLKGTYWWINFYIKCCFFFLRIFGGIHIEIRGEIPRGNILVCSKHMSFLDILILSSVLSDYSFVIKRQLIYAPIINFYAMRVGSVPVNRKKGGAALTEMINRIEAHEEALPNRQLVIYPQGTRVLPGHKKPYKIGAGVLYQKYNRPCHLVATNTGVFWGRRSPFRYPGTAIIEFIGVIPAGLEINDFMRDMEIRIERSSDLLMQEAKKTKI